VVIAMLYTSIGIGLLVLVSLAANMIGYWILGAVLGIILTLPIISLHSSDRIHQNTKLTK